MATLSTNDLCLIGAVIIACYMKKKRVRTKWTKQWLTKRNIYSHVHLLNELRLEPDDWRNYLRMDEDTIYVELLQLVTPLIEKQDTRMKKAITPHESLSTTLRFLATERNYEDLKYAVAVSPQALGKIIPETCRAICSVLWTEYMKFPASEIEWKEIAKGFEKRWNFPNCLGAVDGKHVLITPPPGSGSHFYNYKGFHSLVLMAIVNSNYEFIMCDFGTNGRVSDGGVTENTLFYDKLTHRTLNIPPPDNPEDSEKKLPFVFIGDEAFALRPDFLKPFSQKELNYGRKIFNYRLSRARNVVENAFGILAARFRIFHTPINLKLINIEQVVLACCSLHNFLRRKCTDSYAIILDDKNDENGTITNDTNNIPLLIDLQRGRSRHAGQEAEEVRELYLKYFNEEGQVSWQHNRVTYGKTS